MWSISNVIWFFYHNVSKANYVGNTPCKEHEWSELIDELCIDTFMYLTNEFPVLNTLRPRQNGHHFPDDIFKCIFLNENV